MTLGTQLRLGGRRPDPAFFVPPKSCMQGFVVNKPEGGLWTSTYEPGIGSDWARWCLNEDFRVPRGGWRSWLLEPEPSARVYNIDSYADLEGLAGEYRWSDPFFESTPLALFGRTPLDFAALAIDFDAIHLTEAGQEDTRLSSPLTLYGWDCESTVWLRWAFTKVTDLGRRTWAFQKTPA